MRRRLISLMVLVAASLPLVVQPGDAQAATTCGPYVALYDGTNIVGITHYGVSANITAQKGVLCGSSTSASAAWTMIADAGATFPGYVQSGYVHLPGSSSMYQFAEYDKNSTVPYVYKQGASVSAGAKTNYEQVYNFSSGTMSMWVGSNDLLNTSFDPAVAWGGNTWYAEWEGETHYNGDDMPGTSGTHVHFTNMQVWNCRSCAWITPSGLTLSADSTRYGSAWVNSQSSFDIWTK